MIFRQAIALVLFGLALGQAAASICAACNALPNARLAVAGAVTSSGQRLAAAAGQCEFEAVCSIAGASVAPVREADTSCTTTVAQPHAAARIWSSRTIKPPLHPPKAAV